MFIAGHLEAVLISVTNGATIIVNIVSYYAKGKNRALECLSIKCCSLEVTKCHLSS